MGTTTRSLVSARRIWVGPGNAGKLSRCGSGSSGGWCSCSLDKTKATDALQQPEGLEITSLLDPFFQSISQSVPCFSPVPCTHTHVHTHAHVHTPHMHTHMYTHTSPHHTHTHTHRTMYTHTHTHTHTQCTHTCTPTHPHPHTHTHACLNSCVRNYNHMHTN